MKQAHVSREHPANPAQRLRFAEQITLRVFALVLQQEIQLLGRLHAFGDHLHIETTRHADDRR